MYDFLYSQVSGIPANQGSLYKPQIEQMFSICGNILALHMEETKLVIFMFYDFINGFIYLVI